MCILNLRSGYYRISLHGCFYWATRYCSSFIAASVSKGKLTEEALMGLQIISIHLIESDYKV